MSVSDIIIFYNTYNDGMWVRVLACYILCVYTLTFVLCHLPNYFTTPSNVIDQYCMLAKTCIHDTIPVCGRMGEEKRSFLDVCDLLEFVCDTNQVYTHVDDMKDCPKFRVSQQTIENISGK